MSSDPTVPGICEESIYRARLIHAWKCSSFDGNEVPTVTASTTPPVESIATQWHQSFFGLQLDLEAAHHKSLALKFPLSLQDKRQLQSLYAPLRVIVRARLSPTVERGKNPICLAEHERAYRQLDHVLVNDWLVKFDAVCLLDVATLNRVGDRVIADDDVAVLDGNERTNTAMEHDALRVALALQRVLSNARVGKPFELLFARHNHAKAQRAIVKYAQQPQAKQAQDAQHRELLQEAKTKPMEEKRKREFQMQQMDLTLESFLFDMLGDKLVLYQEAIVQSGVWQAYQVANVSWYLNARNGRLYAENPMRMLAARQMIWGATVQSQIAARKLQRRVKAVLKSNQLTRDAINKVIDTQTTSYFQSVFESFWSKELQPFYEQIRSQLVLAKSNSMELQAMEIWERWKHYKHPEPSTPPAPDGNLVALKGSKPFATAMMASKLHQLNKKQAQMRKEQHTAVQLNKWSVIVKERAAASKLQRHVRVWLQGQHLLHQAVGVVVDDVVTKAIEHWFHCLWRDELQSFYHQIESQLLFQKREQVALTAMEVWERWKRRTENWSPSHSSDKPSSSTSSASSSLASSSSSSSSLSSTSSPLPNGTIPELQPPAFYEEAIYRARLIHPWKTTCGSLASSAFSKVWHGSFFGLELLLVAAQNKSFLLHFPLKSHERKLLQSFYPPFHLQVHTKLQLASDQSSQRPPCLFDHESAYHQLEHVLVNDWLVKFDGVCLLDRLESSTASSSSGGGGAAAGDTTTTKGLDHLVVSGGECRQFASVNDALLLVESLEWIREHATIGCAFELLFARHNHVQAHNTIVPFARLPETQHQQQLQHQQLLLKTLQQSDHDKRKKQFELQQMDLENEWYLFGLLNDSLVRLEEQVLRTAQWQAYQFANVLWYFNSARGKLYAEHPMRMLATKQRIWGATLLVHSTAKRLQRRLRAKIDRNNFIRNVIDTLVECKVDELIRFQVDWLWHHELRALYQRVYPQLTFATSKVDLEAMELMEKWRHSKHDPPNIHLPATGNPTGTITPSSVAMASSSIKTTGSSSPERPRVASTVQSMPSPPMASVAATHETAQAPPSPRLPPASSSVSSTSPFGGPRSRSPVQSSHKQRSPTGPTYIVVEALPRTKPAMEVDLTRVCSQADQDESQGEWNEYLRMLKRNPKLRRSADKRKSPNKMHVLAVLTPASNKRKSPKQRGSPTGKTGPATRIQAAYRGYKTRQQQYPGGAYDENDDDEENEQEENEGEEEEEEEEEDPDKSRRMAMARATRMQQERDNTSQHTEVPLNVESDSYSSPGAKKLPYLRRAGQRF